MKWDAGALKEYRNNSPIFRYLSNKPPRSVAWPKRWREELGIFLATPGISWTWVQHNFNMTHQRLHQVHKDTLHLHHLVNENLASVTEGDAIRYLHNRPNNLGEIPHWVVPFILDDIKSGLGWRPTARKWGISVYTVGSYMHGRQIDILHPGLKQGRRKNLGRSV